MSKQEKVRLTVQGIIEDLNNGLTRKEIAEKYSLPMTDIKKVFLHPKLKNLKPRKQAGFILIDEEEENFTDVKDIEDTDEIKRETVFEIEEQKEFTSELQN